MKLTEVDLPQVRRADAPVLANLLELCQYDFTEYDGADTREDGRYGYAYLHRYWHEAGRYACLVSCGGRPAGA